MVHTISTIHICIDFVTLLLVIVERYQSLADL